MSSPRYTIDQLLTLMRCLRNPQQGCPWDIKQTLDSIVPHTLDEVYEVIDAIEQKDYPHLKDELGDLLFQVVFYAQICSEDERFNFADVVDAITKKLLRRHPHVFPDRTLESFGQGGDVPEAEIKANWERIKAEERALEREAQPVNDGIPQAPSALDDIPGATPALMRAHKLQKRAATQGFDWPSLAPVISNLHSEIDELTEAISTGDQTAIVDEYGDVLFSCVNIARHLVIDSEQALRGANHKFEQRFRQVEQLAAERNLEMTQATEAELDALWQQAKLSLISSH